MFNNDNRMWLSFIAAGKYAKEAMNIAIRQCSYEMTAMVFSHLELLKKPQSENWLELYIPVLQSIKEDDLLTYCNLAGQTKYAESKEWVANHVLEVDMFREKIFGH